MFVQRDAAHVAMAPLINDEIPLPLHFALAKHGLERITMVEKRGGDGILMTDDQREDVLKLLGRVPDGLLDAPHSLQPYRWNDDIRATDERGQEAIELRYVENALV